MQQFCLPPKKLARAISRPWITTTHNSRPPAKDWDFKDRAAMQGQSLTECRHMEAEEMLQEHAKEREQAIFDRTEQ